jgi:hypothetical protein
VGNEENSYLLPDPNKTMMSLGSPFKKKNLQRRNCERNLSQIHGEDTRNG